MTDIFEEGTHSIQITIQKRIARGGDFLRFSFYMGKLSLSKTWGDKDIRAQQDSLCKPIQYLIISKLRLPVFVPSEFCRGFDICLEVREELMATKR